MSDNSVSQEQVIYKIFRYLNMDEQAWRVQVWQTPHIDDVSKYVNRPNFFEYEIEVTHVHGDESLTMDSYTGTEWINKYVEVQS